MSKFETTWTREEARQGGNYRYWDGVPCEHGHTSGRYTKSGECVGCQTGKRHLRMPKVKADILTIELAVPPTLNDARRLALLSYLQFECIPAFLKSTA
jgi:hypothetical protein